MKLVYGWQKDNTISFREQYDYQGGQYVLTGRTDYLYDQLTYEKHVENAVSIYWFEYLYDQLGNRLEKIDNLTTAWTSYHYDTDSTSRTPAPPSGQCDTHNNRLLYYIEYDANDVPTRRVDYNYWKFGDVSNITIKDYDPLCPPGSSGCSERAVFTWHRDLSFTYTGEHHLWRAVGGKFQLNGSGQPINYSATAAREFYYNGNGSRYASRDVNPSNGYKPYTSGTQATQQWADIFGLLPYSDHLHDGTTDAFGFFGLTNSREQARYLAGGFDGVPARQDLGTLSSGVYPIAATRYLHGELVSKTLQTDASGMVSNIGSIPASIAFTAFGEPIINGTFDELPSDWGRYAFGGGFGYEGDLLVLSGAVDLGLGVATPPIGLLHLGHRWFDVRAGRFAQRDPLGLLAGLNSYVYVLNNPITYIDPDGLEVRHLDVPAIGQEIKDRVRDTGGPVTVIPPGQNTGGLINHVRPNPKGTLVFEGPGGQFELPEVGFYDFEWITPTTCVIRSREPGKCGGCGATGIEAAPIILLTLWRWKRKRKNCDSQ